ncbi:MAG: DUF5719 family protein [Ornithinimicrobium sp.]
MTSGAQGRPLLRLGALVALLVGLSVAATVTTGPMYLGAQPSEETSSGIGASAERAPVTTSALWCPGPEQQGLSEATVTESPQEVIVQGAAPPGEILGEDFQDPPAGELVVTAGEAPSARITRQGAVLTDSVSAAAAGELLATGGLAPGLSGAQLWLGAQEQEVGLAVTPCRPAVDSAWLIAGGAEPGRAERLVLINPGRAPISVDVQVWGQAGVALQDGGSQIALAPGERRIVLVDALAPSVQAPAVQVEATGGPVTAYLGDRWLSGTTDQGWDLSGATTDPATSHLLAGVFNAQEGSADEAEQDAAPSPITLRVVVPGPDQAVVQIQALTDQGPVELPTDVALLPGQQSTDIEIKDLPDGTSALAVDSDEPALVSAQLSTSPSEKGRADIAWVTSAAPIDGLAGTPLPQATEAEAPQVAYRLHVAAPLGGRAQVFTVGAGGEVSTSKIDAPPGTATEVELADAQAVWIQAQQGQIFAAVSAGGLIQVSDADPTAQARSEQQAEDAEPTGADRASANDVSVDDVSVIAVLALTDLQRYRSLVDLVPQRP